MWNSVIALDKTPTNLDDELVLTVVRLRHIACDAIMIAAAVLDFVSSKYDIGEVLFRCLSQTFRTSSSQLTFSLRLVVVGFHSQVLYNGWTQIHEVRKT